MNVFALTCAELAAELSRRYGKGMYHAAALCRELFKRGNTSFADAPEFLASPALAVRLTEDLCLPRCRIVGRQEEAGVVKFSSAMADGHLIESVLIPGRGRTTLCVSSQVGCRMGCTFCVTGGMGFVRDLTVEEIVWQVHAARFPAGSSDRQPGVHGHGGAARQLRQSHAGPACDQRSARAGHRTQPHHPFNRGACRRHPETRCIEPPKTASGRIPQCSGR